MRTDSNVTANKSVTANFAINTYTLSYTAGSGGTISGTSPQTVNYNASGSAVTAVPNAGRAFISWSDGVMTAARTDSNVTASKSVTANFALAAPDTTPPTTTSDAQATYQGDASIKLTATDGTGSGVAATYYKLDAGAQQSGTTIGVPAPASGGADHTIEFWSVDASGNVEAPHKTANFSVVAVQSATLQFRWEPSSWSQADLHVENSSGVTVASTSVSGYGSDLDWDVQVPAGQTYTLVCDYYYDGDADSEGGGYSISSGLLSNGGVYTWWY